MTAPDWLDWARRWSPTPESTGVASIQDNGTSPPPGSAQEPTEDIRSRIEDALHNAQLNAQADVGSQYYEGASDAYEYALELLNRPAKGPLR